MAIDFDAFFASAGKAFHAGETTLAAALAVESDVEAFAQDVAAGALADYVVIESLRPSLTAWQAAAPGFLSVAVRQAVQNLLIRYVEADNPQPSASVDAALAEFIRQMEAAAETLDASAVSASVSYDANNVGDGVLVASVKRADGRANELLYAEDLVAVIGASGTATVEGEEAAPDSLSHLHPAGSGASASLVSVTAAAGQSLVAGAFEEADPIEPNLPAGWIVGVGTLGTTIKLTPVEVQTITASSDPSGGWFALEFTDAAGDKRTTAPLPYDVSAAAMQTALRELAALEEVAVTRSGTAPNYVWTVTLHGVTNPAELTVVNETDGTLTPDTTTEASEYAVRGARCLELDSDGAELSALYYPVAVAPLAQYAVNLFAAVDVVPDAGVLTVDLVDGIGGSVIADEEGTNNAFTIDATTLTTTPAAKSGVFRTPRELPSQAYLRVRISTAVSSGTSVFLDEVAMAAMTELYAGGPSAALFTGRTPWIAGDRATITAANDRAGKMLDWMDRAFNLRESNLLLPTAGGGGETIDDGLIA